MTNKKKNKNHLSKNKTIIKHNDLDKQNNASNEASKILTINEIFRKIKQWDDYLYKEKVSNNTIIHPELPREFTKEQIYYGSRNIVKQGLPYQLGELTVQHEISFQKVKVIPYNLFTLLNKKKVSEKNKSLNLFRDLNEAEKVKNHLSYKIGNTLVEGLSSPSKFVRMPITMAKEVITFKKKH